MASQTLPAQAKQLFHYLFEQASLGIAVEDFEGILLLANPALCSMLGYQEKELCGMNCSQFAYPEDSKDDWALFQQLRAGVVDQYSLEKRYVRKDGTQLWGRLNVSLLKNGDGGSSLIFAFVEDITERRRTEEALREREQQLDLAVQAGKMYAFDWDTQTDVIVRSGECAHIVNWTDDPKHDTGRNFCARVHPDDRKLYAAAEAGLTPGNPDYQICFRVLRPDGTVVWLEDTGRASFDSQGRMLKVLGMVADITERKRAEEAIKRSESKYRLFVSQISEGIFCQELERPIPVGLPEDEQVQRILHESYLAECNDALARMYGMSPADFVGKRLTETLDAENPRNIDLTRAYIRGGYRVMDRESREVDPQGNPKVFLNSMIGIVENDMLRRTWGIQRDITERKRAEEALSSMTQRLIEAQEQERARISRDLHDDVGQRLALLANHLEQLRQDSPDLSTEVRNRLGEIYEQSCEIATGVQALSHELHSAKLVYLGIASAMRSFCQEFAKQQKLEIDFNTLDLPDSVSPDISLCLFRVLQEALRNSAKHSGARQLEVRLWGTSDEVHLAVSDSGIGFDSEAAKESRGLGLVSMEERLKLLHGAFSVESQPNRGTTIHACVPISKSDLMRVAG